MAAALHPHSSISALIYPLSSNHRRRPRTSALSSAADGIPFTHQSVEQKKPSQGFNRKNKRVFFLDVNPLCYKGNTPSLHSLAYWLSLFFSQVSLSDPVIAVLDGENGNEYRRQLLPSYKAHRRRFTRQFYEPPRFTQGFRGSPHYAISPVMNVLHKCNVPVVKVHGYEADDVVATLVDQVLQRGLRVVVGSPDKDFKQLISEDVQIVMPMPEFGRWSFYTLKHYMAQYNCNPSCDLSLRCIMGDEVDGVPGIQHLAPGFGRKTALKLIKKHGSLENLLNAALTRTVGKPYAQIALTTHADYLRKNYQVLSLRRDVEVQIEEEWLHERNANNDLAVLSSFVEKLGGSQKLNERRASSLVKCCTYCPKSCHHRCGKASNKMLCLASCYTCCHRCHCVPRRRSKKEEDECLCYVKMKTSAGKAKCP